VPYDPTLFLGAAVHYARARPPYSYELAATVARELGLDCTGRLLDAGCGPAVLTLELAPLFDEVIALDPDADMLAEGARRAEAARLQHVRWVRAVAEDIPALDLGTFRLVVFGQSFWWTDRERVAGYVWDLLEPGGALALVEHAHEGRPAPDGPGHPPIPHDVVEALVDEYLGPVRRAGQGLRPNKPERHGEVLARTSFGTPAVVFAPGRSDIVRDVDGVLSSYLSNSFSAPHLFGDRLPQFEADVRAALASRSPSGLFWDWPGDTAIIIARKPASPA
jgi:SAM-dependent methyltransferase